jgi:hypothetical protein
VSDLPVVPAVALDLVVPAIQLLETGPDDVSAVDPAQLILTCANCGAPMDERKCKLICRCGYFLSCSDYY